MPSRRVSSLSSSGEGPSLSCLSPVQNPHLQIFAQPTICFSWDWLDTFFFFFMSSSVNYISSSRNYLFISFDFFSLRVLVFSIWYARSWLKKKIWGTGRLFIMRVANTLHPFVSQILISLMMSLVKSFFLLLFHFRYTNLSNFPFLCDLFLCFFFFSA